MSIKLHLSRAAVVIGILDCNMALAQDGLVRESLDKSEAILRNVVTGALWYPHLDRLAGMTKPEQQAEIDGMNTSAYGGQTNWRFASFEEVLNLMPLLTADFTNEEVNGAIRTRSPVQPDLYLDPSHPNITPNVSLFCGRTTDEWALREDLDFSVDIRWGESNYHFRWNYETKTVRFDDDLNYIPDDGRFAPPPVRGPERPPVLDPIRECGAWVIAVEE